MIPIRRTWSISYITYIIHHILLAISHHMADGVLEVEANHLVLVLGKVLLHSLDGSPTTIQRHTRYILGGTNFFLSYLWHFYDDNCDKIGIIIDVVGSYFYGKKSWQKMGFSSWAGWRRSCMTFFGPSMTEKTMVEVRARKILGCSRLRWVVGAERCMEVCAFLSYTHAHGCEASSSNSTRAIALQAMRYWTRAIDRWLLTEPDRSIPSLLLLTEADRCCL